MLGIDGLTARRRINLSQYVILNVASVEQLIKLVSIASGKRAHRACIPYRADALPDLLQQMIYGSYFFAYIVSVIVSSPTCFHDPAETISCIFPAIGALPPFPRDKSWSAASHQRKTERPHRPPTRSSPSSVKVDSGMMKMTYAREGHVRVAKVTRGTSGGMKRNRRFQGSLRSVFLQGFRSG